MKRILTAWIYVLPLVGIGQNDTSLPGKNVLSAGINYQSKLHFFGRTDSLQSAGLFPTLRFDSKTGLYVNSGFIFLNNAVTPTSYTGTVVEGGYKFPETKNFSGNMFYSQFLYKDNSQVVQSALKSQAGINLVYNNKIVNVTGGADAKFSNRTDFGVTGGLDHLFIYIIPGTKNAIAVNPSAYIYAGSQNFTQIYYKKTHIIGIPTGQNQQVTENVNRFNILSYEISMPVVLVAGKFNASITGSYVMPKNLIAVANRPDLTERGKDMFYVTAGIGVRL